MNPKIVKVVVYVMLFAMLMSSVLFSLSIILQ